MSEAEREALVEARQALVAEDLDGHERGGVEEASGRKRSLTR